MTLIGDESFSKVRNAIEKKTSAQRVVRIIPKADLLKVTQFDKKFVSLKQLDHVNLNKIIEVYDDNHFFYLASDFIKGGDLFTALSKRQNHFMEKDAAHVVK